MQSASVRGLETSGLCNTPCLSLSATSNPLNPERTACPPISRRSITGTTSFFDKFLRLLQVLPASVAVSARIKKLQCEGTSSSHPCLTMWFPCAQSRKRYVRKRQRNIVKVVDNAHFYAAGSELRASRNSSREGLICTPPKKTQIPANLWLIVLSKEKTFQLLSFPQPAEKHQSYFCKITIRSSCKNWCPCM